MNTGERKERSEKRHVNVVWIAAGIGALLLGAMAVGILRSRTGAEEVVIYSGRREQFVTPVLEDFEQLTGIRVRLLSGSATSFAHRITEERRRPQADIFLANDAGIMEYLRRQGVLQPVEVLGVDRVSEKFRAGDHSWVGLSARARVLMYNKELIGEDEMPRSLFDLTAPRYSGRFAITRAGNSSLVSHMAAVRAARGDSGMKDFIRGVLANDPPVTSGHTDIRRMVGAGEIEFGLVNCYYFRLQLDEDRNNNVGVVYPDQDEGQPGTFVNVAGAAFIDGAPNYENALKLLEYLLQPQQLQRFSDISRETPILPDAEHPEGGKPIDAFRWMDMPLTELGGVWEDTLDAMEEAGFAE